jgi:hypothetical protein
MRKAVSWLVSGQRAAWRQEGRNLSSAEAVEDLHTTPPVYRHLQKGKRAMSRRCRVRVTGKI